MGADEPPARRPAIKFCGLTRPEDVEAAVSAGASYVGVIFAGGPRRLTPERAREVLQGVPTAVRRVGVFGAAAPDEIARVVEIAGLDVVQLHSDPTETDVRAVRDRTSRDVWAVIRVRGDDLPAEAATLFAAADGVVLDALAPSGLGGTGISLPWARLNVRLEALRGAGRGLLVLAGGLRSGNVVEASRLVSPDVVDVSSGVESSPGIKDHAQLAAFGAAVRALE